MAVSTKQAARHAVGVALVVVLGVTGYVLGFLFGLAIGWMALAGGPN